MAKPILRHLLQRYIFVSFVKAQPNIPFRFQMGQFWTLFEDFNSLKTRTLYSRVHYKRYIV